MDPDPLVQLILAGANVLVDGDVVVSGRGSQKRTLRMRTVNGVLVESAYVNWEELDHVDQDFRDKSLEGDGHGSVEGCGRGSGLALGAMDESRSRSEHL